MYIFQRDVTDKRNLKLESSQPFASRGLIRSVTWEGHIYSLSTTLIIKNDESGRKLIFMFYIKKNNNLTLVCNLIFIHLIMQKCQCFLSSIS